jgi:hypothetical protein
MSWKFYNDDIPLDKELILYLKAPAGEEKPIGQIIAVYMDNDFFCGWAAKTGPGIINNGLPQELITHWKELDDPPES